MPQLDPSSFVSQIFWLLITFLSLWFFMSWFILPRIRQILDEREEKIENYIQKAEKIKEQALISLDVYEKEIQKAHMFSEQKMTEEKAQMQAQIELKKAQINQVLTQKIEENEQRLKKERSEVLNAVDEVSHKAAQQILEKLGLDINKDSPNAGN